jgi:hypothetical protein
MVVFVGILYQNGYLFKWFSIFYFKMEKKKEKKTDVLWTTDDDDDEQKQEQSESKCQTFKKCFKEERGEHQYF